MQAQNKAASTLGLSVINIEFTLTQGLITISKKNHLSMNTLSTNSTFQILTTNHPDSPGAWLQEIRVSESRLQKRTSMSVNSAVDIYQPCDVNSCSGCRFLEQYRLCYAA
mmetsp:Transcript_29649/g.46469  ORF Transcript_29649/g.46469 Transcript_29649/m.46469 type:complete len:110 (+) Transcript_29649:442-771(+)